MTNVEAPTPGCYRHATRGHAVTCQRCERPICTECMTSASVGFHCPECLQSGQQQIVRGTRSSFTAGPLPVVSTAVIGANLIVHLAGLALGSPLWPTSGTFGRRGISQCRLPTGDLLVDGALHGCAIDVQNEWWRLLTSGFLHSGFFHIAMNMLLLWIIGKQLEGVMGKANFALLYFGSLFAGSMGALMVEPDRLTVGASGAVYGLMAAIVLASRAKGINPWDSGLGSLIIVNLVFTFAIPNISKGGHIGGLIGGFILGAIFFEIGPRLAKATSPNAARAVTSAVAVVVSVAFVVGGLWAAGTWTDPIF